MVRYSKETEIKTVRFLRFNSEDPPTATHTYVWLEQIAKFINRSVPYVYRIC